MSEFRSIQMFLFLILMLQFEAHEQMFTVRAGDDVALPCENVMKENNCDGLAWIFSGKSQTTAATLFEYGKIHRDAKSKLGRLNITENCSLDLKKVTKDDAGLYSCRLYHSGQIQGPGSQVDLSVVTMEEHENNRMIQTFCAVHIHDFCRHSVRWLFEGNQEDFPDMVIAQHSCSSSVTFTASHNNKAKYLEVLKCEVKDRNTKESQLFTFSSESTDEEPEQSSSGLWWLYVGAAVVLTTLLVVVVGILRRKKNKGNKSETENNVGQDSNPVETASGPGTNQDTVDAEDGVSYAAIVYNRKTKDKVRDVADDADEGDSVTYSTVRTSPSPGSDPDPGAVPESASALLLNNNTYSSVC